MSNHYPEYWGGFNQSLANYHARLYTALMLARDTERFKARSLTNWVTQ